MPSLRSGPRAWRTGSKPCSGPVPLPRFPGWRKEPSRTENIGLRACNAPERRRAMRCHRSGNRAGQCEPCRYRRMFFSSFGHHFVVEGGAMRAGEGGEFLNHDRSIRLTEAAFRDTVTSGLQPWRQPSWPRRGRRLGACRAAHIYKAQREQGNEAQNGKGFSSSQTPEIHFESIRSASIGELSSDNSSDCVAD